MPFKKNLLCWVSASMLIGLAPAGRASGQVREAWVARYNGPGDLNDIAYAVGVDSAGNVYVTGYSEVSDTGLDYTTLKYDPDGKLLWERRYDGPGSGADIAYALALDRAGNVYVTGVSRGSDTGDSATLKYDSDGNLLWVYRYNGPDNGFDQALAIAVDGELNVYVTGESQSADTGADYSTLKFDGDGNLLWQRRYNGPGNSFDIALALSVDEAGNVYVTGESAGAGGDFDYATLKYDPNGVLAWARRHNGPGDSVDEGRDLAVDSAGNVYVTGRLSVGGPPFFEDYGTLKYDSEGNLLWERRYNGPGGFDLANAIAVDSADNVYVTGLSVGAGLTSDYATLKYNSDGALLWEQRYDGPGKGLDRATALVVDSADNVYVTGESSGLDTGLDYSTLKYHPDGDLLWEQRYNGPGNADEATRSLAVDQAGNVYVTGLSPGSKTGLDFATIKYVQK